MALERAGGTLCTGSAVSGVTIAHDRATGITLAEAATALDASETHLVRAFSREHGIAPHQYLTGRRLDLARHLLLAGRSVADTAVEAGWLEALRTPMLMDCTRAHRELNWQPTHDAWATLHEMAAAHR